MEEIFLDGIKVIIEWIGDVYRIVNDDDLTDEQIEKVVKLMRERSGK